MHDILFKNALLLDGSGTAPWRADLAVKDGRIAAIGRIAEATASEVVDATDLALMPGIIDGHTHLDAQLTWDPFADPSPSLGVTTVVIGNCGFTLAPCKPEHRDMTLRNLTQVEGMSLDALREGVQWDFVTFADFLAALERRGVGLNVAAFVGHSSVRSFVMGSEASRRVASTEEIEAMALIVREAMEAGAVGFSSTAAPAHNGEGGVPMPSRLADARELEALTGVMGTLEQGVFMITRGGPWTVTTLIELAGKCGRPALISGFLHNPAAPDKHRIDLAELAAARDQGTAVWGEVTCCPLTMDFTVESAYMFEGFDAWRPAMAAKGEALKQVYADPGFRAAVKTELVELKGKRTFNSEWDKLKVIEVAMPEHRPLEGKSMEELAAAQGKHPLDAMLDLALTEDMRTQFSATLLNSDPVEVAKIIADPQTYVTLSDAGAHITFFCDAGFGLHLLGHWARDLKALPLEEAVRKLTRQPAELFGIVDRGRLQEGYAADLLLFDPKAVGRGPNQRVRDFPAGAARLVTPALGVHGVWVNGVRVVKSVNGQLARDQRAGVVLREFDRNAGHAGLATRTAN